MTWARASCWLDWPWAPEGPWYPEALGSRLMILCHSPPGKEQQEVSVGVSSRKLPELRTEGAMGLLSEAENFREAMNDNMIMVSE